LIFARQAGADPGTYIGYQHTTGMRAMDYRLTDAWCDPPGMIRDTIPRAGAARHDVLLLPQRPDAPPSGPLPCQSNGFHHLWFAEQFAKVTPECWRRGQPSGAVPDSRLVLLGFHDRLGRERSEVLGSGKSGRERIEVIGSFAASAYMDDGWVDVALDSFVFNATRRRATVGGSPRRDLAGRTYASRFGGSAEHARPEGFDCRERGEYVEVLP